MSDGTPRAGRLVGSCDSAAADPWRELVAAVLVRAIRDLADVDHCGDARGWLGSDWAIDLLGWLGYDVKTVLARLAIEGKRSRGMGWYAQQRVSEFIGDQVVVSMTTRETLPLFLVHAFAEAEGRARDGQIPGCVLHRCHENYEDSLLVIRLGDLKRLQGARDG